MPRIDPLPESEWNDDIARILGANMTGTEVRLGDNNVFTTLARHPDLFKKWLPFGGFLLGAGVLGARERELLILRTGFNCGSDYEWGQHVRLSEMLGIAREDVDRVAHGPDADGWSETDRALLRAADELHADSKISDATWEALASAYDERGRIEIAMLVGQYHMVAFALNSLEVELDPGLESLPSAPPRSSGG